MDTSTARYYRFSYARQDGTEYDSPCLVPSTRASVEAFVAHHVRMEEAAPRKWHRILAVTEYFAEFGGVGITRAEAERISSDGP